MNNTNSYNSQKMLLSDIVSEDSYRRPQHSWDRDIVIVVHKRLILEVFRQGGKYVSQNGIYDELKRKRSTEKKK